MKTTMRLQRPQMALGLFAVAMVSAAPATAGKGAERSRKSESIGPSLLDGRPVQRRFEIYANPAIAPATRVLSPIKRNRGRALLAGEVLAVSTDSVTVWSLLYENHERTFVAVEYQGLTNIAVVQGQQVATREKLGEAAVGTIVVRSRRATPLERRPSDALRHVAPVPDVEAFLAARSQLFDPASEPQLILVDKDSYALQIREEGVSVVELSIGYGQEKGRKRVQGDLKTPSGMYFVVDKKRREFGGKYGAYFGGHWIKINYPNAYDAAWGEAEGVLSARQRRAVTKQWRKRKLPSQGTRLGGGIGFHGWIGPRETRDDWSDANPHQTWGCILMHNVDISAHYDRIKVGAMVVLF